MVIGFFASPFGAGWSEDKHLQDYLNRSRATGCGEFSKILPAVTDELWKLGYSDEDIAKIYSGNKMRVYREVWEGFAPEDDPVNKENRKKFIEDQRAKFLQR